MDKPLFLRSPASKNYHGRYAIIRRADDLKTLTLDGQWIVFDETRRAKCAISLSDAGGGYWLGDMPTGVDAGTRLHIDYIARRGNKPGSDDLLLANRAWTWTGETLTDGAAATTAKIGTGEPFAPKEADIEILIELSKKQTLVVYGLLNPRNVGERMLKERMPILEENGLVHRPNGKRSGWAITSTGRRLLS